MDDLGVGGELHARELTLPFEDATPKAPHPIPEIGWGQIGAKKHPKLPISAGLDPRKQAVFIGSRQPQVGVWPDAARLQKVPILEVECPA